MFISVVVFTKPKSGLWMRDGNPDLGIRFTGTIIDVISKCEGFISRDIFCDDTVLVVKTYFKTEEHYYNAKRKRDIAVAPYLNERNVYFEQQGIVEHLAIRREI